jgi:hypothetical protein
MIRGQRRFFIKEIEAVKIYDKETGELLAEWPEKENSEPKTASITVKGEEDLLPKEQWEHNFYV